MLKVSYFCMRYLHSNVIQKCYYHSHKFSRNIELLSNEKLPAFNGFQVMEKREKNKPLILLYAWMLAKDKHILKYSKFYLDRGFDVLNVKIFPLELLRPVKGVKMTSNDVLEILHLNPVFNPLVVHGFSIGGYVFSESVVKMSGNMPLYNDVLKRFAGQIWDSVADFHELPVGLPRAITDSKVIQKSMEKYFRWFLNWNYETATKHYEKASSSFKGNLINAPGLFIFSKTDPVSNREVNMPVVRKWETMGFEVYTKCFEKSSHVSHFLEHRAAYEEEVTAFLEKIGVLRESRKRAILS